MNDIAPMHDFWVAYKTLANGGILTHLPFSTGLYCQHSNNVVGANNVGIKYIWLKLKNLKNVFLNNVDKFKIMNQISGISIFKYIYCKLSFEIVRFL